MSDVKRANVITSLEGNPLSAAYTSYERPADAAGALPELVADGQNRRSEDAAIGVKSTHGDPRGGQDSPATKQSKADKKPALSTTEEAGEQTPRQAPRPPAPEPPAMTAEMQDALFEEAMDQIVGNYSIVLNFNS